MKKRILSLLLVLSMMISLFPATALAKPVEDMSNGEKLSLLANPFTDVKEKDWCYDAVQYARINGIFNGVTATSFDPNGTLTRGMFVTVLGRMAGVETKDYEGQAIFSDVPTDKYFAPYVAWAYKYGITTGTGGDKFSPYAPINRQQMATFFVRYFEAFGVDYETGANITSIPLDMDGIASYAKDTVLKLWKQGLLNGDGKNFNPVGKATRAQTATLCMRADRAVAVWYREPGVPSSRVSIDPADIKIDAADNYCQFYFYDDEGKCFDVKSTKQGYALNEMPSVEKSSREGRILLGYYLDPEYTKPFYPETPAEKDTDVYAKYHQMEDNTILNLTTFTQMDQSPNLTFTIEEAESGSSTNASYAATLTVKDGSDPVDLAVTANGDGTYTVSAVGGFNKGCTYELTLAKGWNFVGKADTIRTASFSIIMEEVNNLRLNEDIVYVKDTPQLRYTVGGKQYDVLESGTLTAEHQTGSFVYSGSETITAGDLLCVYVGTHPNDRINLSNDNNPDNDSALLDPAVYVKVKSVENGVVTFAPLDEEDQQKLYEVPDLFPFYVTELPTSGGSVNLNDLDLSLYETAMGKENGTLKKALDKANVGDFVVFYTQLSQDTDASDLFYGRITGYNNATGAISYAPSTEEELLNSMDLYSVVDVQGNALVSDEQKEELEAVLYQQVEESGFAEEAAYILADLVSKTDGFQENLNIQDFLMTDSEGNPLSPEEIQLLNLGGSFELTDDVELTVELITKGDQLHFNDGVQLAIGVDASFEVEAEDGVVAIDLSATFVQEVTVKPTVKGDLTYTTILGISFPNGVQVNANIDVKSYTGLSFAAEIYTVAEEEASTWSKLQSLKDAKIPGFPGLPESLTKGLESVGDVMDKIDELQNAIDRGTLSVTTAKTYAEDIQSLWNALENSNLASREDWENMADALGKTSITSDLLGLSDLSAETGLSTEYYDSLDSLMQKYNETVTKETDWIKLLEEQIFVAEVCVVGICIGVEVSFVVRADMSIAIGSSLQRQSRNLRHG